MCNWSTWLYTWNWHTFYSVQSLSRVRLFATPWTAACKASLSITKSRNLLKLMSIGLVMPSNYLILFHPLLLLPSIFPSIRVFSNESVPCHCLLQKSPWQEHMSQWVGEQGAGTCRVYKCESRVKVLLGGKTRSIYKSECVCAQSLQLCLTLCDPMGFNPPGFSVHGILQARILAWVAIPSSRGSSQPRGWLVSPALQADSLPLKIPGKPGVC